jgi:hypothetical protein
MYEDFAQNFGDKKTGWDNAPSHTSLFTREFFLLKNNMTFISPPTLFACPGALQLFSLSLHFETIEMIEVQSQVVPNTLTEHDFQDP